MAPRLTLSRRRRCTCATKSHARPPNAPLAPVPARTARDAPARHDTGPCNDAAMIDVRAFFATLTSADLDTLVAIESSAYAFPWSRGNFIDSLNAGYLGRKRVDA